MRLAAVSRTALNSLAVLGSRHCGTRLQGAVVSAFATYPSGRQWAIASHDGGGSNALKAHHSSILPRQFDILARNGNTGRISRQQQPMAMSASSVSGAVVNDAASGVCAEVLPVPILQDNYAYLLIDPATGKTACVDPAEPSKVVAAAKDRGVEISAILCTHKHWDHSGGNEEMKRMIADLDVVSSAYEDDVPGMTIALKDQEEYSLGSLTIRALHTPCHTRGHVLFYVTSSSDVTLAPLVFSGDTLFVGGCGRFFEGDASQMVHALQGVASKLPPETRVFCGHEYTISNLLFAQSVEPESTSVADKLQWSKRILANGGYTVPSTIAQELQHNPFMRVNDDAVRKATGASDGVGAMARLREMKNGYRPPPENSGRFPSL